MKVGAADLSLSNPSTSHSHKKSAPVGLATTTQETSTPVATVVLQPVAIANLNPRTMAASSALPTNVPPASQQLRQFILSHLCVKAFTCLTIKQVAKSPLSLHVAQKRKP